MWSWTDTSQYKRFTKSQKHHWYLKACNVKKKQKNILYGCSRWERKSDCYSFDTFWLIYDSRLVGVIFLASELSFPLKTTPIKIIMLWHLQYQTCCLSPGEPGHLCSTTLIKKKTKKCSVYDSDIPSLQFSYILINSAALPFAEAKQRWRDFYDCKGSRLNPIC